MRKGFLSICNLNNLKAEAENAFTKLQSKLTVELRSDISMVAKYHLIRIPSSCPMFCTQIIVLELKSEILRRPNWDPDPEQQLSACFVLIIIVVSRPRSEIDWQNTWTPSQLQLSHLCHIVYEGIDYLIHFTQFYREILKSDNTGYEMDLQYVFAWTTFQVQPPPSLPKYQIKALKLV